MAKRLGFGFFGRGGDLTATIADRRVAQRTAAHLEKNQSFGHCLSKTRIRLALFDRGKVRRPEGQVAAAESP